MTEFSETGDFVVAGGYYFERCLTPPVEAAFGSGGRAAAAIASFAPVTLHTFSPTNEHEDLILNMAAHRVRVVVHDSPESVEFYYQFPLSPPRISPFPPPKAPDAHVAADRVLRFGCLEGEMVVSARRAIFDPQSAAAPQAFGANGSRAEELAIVLNDGELFTLSPASDRTSAVRALVDRPAVVIVKAGPYGAFIFEHGTEVGHVPAYRSSSVYKIGTGDIFSAMFAYHWGTGQANACAAAEVASKYVAHYVETRHPALPSIPKEREPLYPSECRRKVYLAGPFFNTQQVWILEEVRSALLDLEVDHFSPFHDVGVLFDDVTIAEKDLKGLADCDLVLALLTDMDPGTLFEVGHAISVGKPIIAFVDLEKPHDLTMLRGSGCSIYSDLASAIYATAWATME